jgi:quercetin 2,3-dioxygenase
MSITIRRSHERGHADHGWLKSWHTFSFADYIDRNWMGFRSLRVINEDIVQPGMGFGTHPHRDMEIITYILSGALEHKDSMGNGRVIQTGDIQYMSAGTGVEHSEFNPSSSDPVHLLQIWIRPDQKGVSPRYEDRSVKLDDSKGLHLLAGRTGRNGSISLHQDADLYLGRLSTGDKVTHSTTPERGLWLQLASGSIDLNGEILNAGDGAAIQDVGEIEFECLKPTQLLLFDLL